MLPTYPAILRDDRLEWGSKGAPAVSPNQPIPVHVTVLASDSVPPANGPDMASALTAFASAGGPTSFGDPVEWQRDARRVDRNLPGRVE